MLDFNTIHYFPTPDGWLLLDVNSGSIYNIDADTAQVLDKLAAAGDFDAVNNLSESEAEEQIVNGFLK